MMSPPRAIKTKNAQKTADYYVNEESYYTDATQPYFSQWFGKGAAHLGLKGPVDASTLAALYDGHLPGGFHIKPGSNGERKAGYDLVFAMPKSASQVVLIGGDYRVYEAFVAAVKFTLSLIEADCAQSRRRVDGEIVYEKTGNLTVAMMTHFTSRALDPHVHIHGNILNQTLGNDGKWGALASDSEVNPDDLKGFAERLFANQKYYGAIFMADFQKRVVDCGWQTETVGPNGMWEMVDIPKAVRTLQSKRRNEIEKALARYTAFTQKQADIVTLATRPDKVAVEPESLTAFWQDEIKTEAAFDVSRIVARKMAEASLAPLPIGEALQQGKVNVALEKEVAESLPRDIEPSALVEKDEPLSKPDEIAADPDTLTPPENAPPDVPGTTAPTNPPPATGKPGKVPPALPAPTPARIPGGSATPPSNTTPVISVQRAPQGNAGTSASRMPPVLQVAGLLARKEATENSIRQATTAVETSILTLSTFKHQFRFERLVEQALSQAKGQFRLLEVKAVIEDKITTGDLLGLDKVASHLTTRAQLEREAILLEKTKTLKNKGYRINQSKLSGYSNAVQTLLSPASRLAIATVPKRLPLDAIHDLVNAGESAGKKVRLLVPNRIEYQSVQGPLSRTSKNVIEWFTNQFKQERVDTVAGYLLAAEKRLHSPFRFLQQDKDCLIIDNATRLSTVDLERLITLSEKNGAKLIFMQHGDKKVAVSDTLAILQKNAIPEVPLKKGHITVARDVVIRDRALPLIITAPEATLVLTDSKKRQRALTETLRKDYQTQGLLGSDAARLTMLSPVFVPNSTDSNPYKAGQQLRIFGKGGGVLRIRRVNTARDTLTLYDERGALHMVKRSRLVGTRHALYEHQSAPIATGERLIATANDKKLGLEKGVTYRATHVSENDITLSTGEKSVTVPLDAWQGLPLQYDYARTLASMGRSQVDEVIVDCNSYVLNKSLTASLQELAKKRLILRVENIPRAEKAMASSVKAGLVQALVVDAAHQLAPERQILTAQHRDKLAEAILLAYQGRNVTEKSIDHAIAVLSERQAGFTFKDIVMLATSEVRGKAAPGDVLAELDRRKADGRLIQGYLRNERYMTTPESLERENALVAHISDGQGVYRAYANDAATIDRFAPAYLTDSQREAMHLILSNQDRFVGIQGFPGSGKSTLWKSVQSALKTLSPKTTLLGLAPTHKAVIGLREKGINSQTLQSFIVDQQKNPTDLSNTLIVLDEVSQASNTALLAFVQLVEKGGARVALQGDARQYQPIEQGKPWDVVLARSTLKVAYNREIVRQKTPLMQTAVKAAVVKDIETAINTLKTLAPDNADDKVPRRESHISQHLKTSVLDVDNLIRDPKYEDLLETDKKGRYTHDSQNAMVVTACVDDYMSRTLSARDKTFVVVATRSDRAWVNNAIRQALQTEGSVGKAEESFARLENTDLEKAKLQVAKNYQSGQIVRLEERYFKVASVDTDNGIIGLVDVKTYDKRDFMPEHYRFPIELYTEAKNSLARGDRIRLTKTFREKGLYANQRWQVEKVEQGLAHLKSEDGKTVHTLSRTQLDDAHWNYDYSVTAFSIQGADKRYAIGLDLAWHRRSVTWRKFLVELTRASHHFVLYTTDTEKLIKQLKTRANKVAAIEVNEDKALRYTLQKPVTPLSKVQGASKTGSQAKASQVTPTPHAPLFPQLDREKMARALAFRVQEVCRHFVGEPDRVTATHYYYNRGITVTISGQHVGTWQHENKNEKHDMLALLQHVQGENASTALKMAIRFLAGKDFAKYYANQTASSPTQTKAPLSESTTVTPSILTSTQQSKMRSQAIEDFLFRVARDITLQVCDEPSKIEGDVYHYEKGLKVFVKGKKMGQWMNSLTGRHGNLVELVSDKLGKTDKESLAYSLDYIRSGPLPLSLFGVSEKQALTYATAFLQGKSIDTVSHTATGMTNTTPVSTQHSQASTDEIKVSPEIQSPSPVNTAAKAEALSKQSSNNCAPQGEATFEGEKHHHAKKSGLYYDGKAIEAALANCVEQFAIHLLGEPAKRTGESLRYGSGPAPSLEITLSNRKGFAGHWTDWGQGKHGKMVDLIREQLGLGYYDALGYASRFLGGIAPAMPIAL